ncbi:MAG TPA: PAS domain S-box protein, partial [Isosphaeraceae bacterium]
MPDQSTDSDAPMQAPPDLSARPEGLHVPIDRLPLAYILCDAEMRVLDWNRAAVGIFGYTKRDAMGRTLLDLIIPQPLDEGLQEVIERVRAGDMHAHSVNGNLTKDGRVITCEWFNTPLMAADGRCVGAICLARDITERKRAEEALVRDALLLANVRDSVIVTDLDGIVTYWNEGATRLFGWRAEEMLGRPYADRFPEPKRSWVAQQIRARAEGTEWSGEYLDDRKDGSRVWIHARVSRLADASGRPVGVLGLAYDISDRKRAEQELTRQNEILQAVFDHIPVMIKFTDPDGRVRLVNRHWEGVTGWSAAECRDRDVLADLYPDPEDRRAVLDYIRHPPPGWSYFKTTTRDGRTRDTTWANVLLSDDTSIGFGLDVTDRLRAEERLRESEERFRQLAENIDGYFWLNALDDDQFFYISPGYETVTGRRCEDLYRRPRSWTESIHPEDRDHVLAAVGASFDAEPRQVEYRIVRPDGSV